VKPELLRVVFAVEISVGRVIPEVAAAAAAAVFGGV
jgi:hypothetical protein